MAELSLEAVVELADRLTPLEQTQLIEHLLRSARGRELSVAERMALLRAAQVDVKVLVEPSICRED